MTEAGTEDHLSDEDRKERMGAGNYPRERRRSKHRAPRARRVEVLTAASHVFAARGFRASTMEDIAEELGVTPGALYYYIRGKDELLEEIAAEPVKRLIDMGIRIADMEVSPVEKIRTLIHQHLAMMIRDRDLFLVSYRERIELAEEPRRALGVLEDRYFAIIRQIVTDGVECGELDVSSPTVVTLALIGMMDWTLLWYRERKSLSIDQVAEIYFGMFLHGLAPKQAGRPAML